MSENLDPTIVPIERQIRGELEAARAAFHALVASVPGSIWEKRAVDSAWTVKEELWHMTWGARFLVDLIRNARHRTGFPTLPWRLVDPLNALYSRLRARSATRGSIGRRYDAAHEAALAQLATVRNDEWQIQVKVLGHAQDLADLFRGIPLHFEEHRARIQPLLAAPRSRSACGSDQHLID